jgi:3-oxoacyl-[acyl-carrier protein] reductase
MELEGRVALVTGSTGRGMGRSIALTLARDGANVALNYETRPERAERVKAQVEALGRRACLVQADVATAAGSRALYDAAVRELGKVDILVVSAGGAWKVQDITDATPEHWQRVLAEEVDAALYLIALVLPGMRARRWGRIILTGGLDADDWREGWPLDYPLGKASRHWLTRSLARREFPNGITVNAIAPGEVLYVELDEALADLARNDAWRARSGPRPQDAGEIAAFLCSEPARFVSGTIVNMPSPVSEGWKHATSPSPPGGEGAAG